MVGGLGVARGYLNQPGLTAERFVPHPFQPGQRLYRTGDRVRLRPDGSLDFLGRLDDQLKIRGFRIEPGDVEAAIRQHSSIEAAVVVGREDVAGERRLVAYVVHREAPPPRVEELCTFLHQRLPDYMVPAEFVPLPAIPLMPNGKVDKRALPAPTGDTRLRLAAVRVVPRNPVEELVAGVWAETLGHESVGVFDNFFDLGGNSLQAARVLFQIQDLLRVELPLRSLLNDPSVAGLAAAILAEPAHRQLLERTASLVLALVDEPEDASGADRRPDVSTVGSPAR
jgi:acyl carrier protein